MSAAKDKESNIFFYQGGEAIGEDTCLKNIKQKITELSNIKNVSFLLGSGTSSEFDAIPSMKAMQDEIEKSRFYSGFFVGALMKGR